MLCLLLLPLITSAAGVPEWTDHNDKPYLVKEFTVDGAGILKTYTLAGNIEVQSVSNTNSVRVELYVERGYAIWSESRNLDNYRINILQRGNEIIASVEEKKRSTGLFSDRVNFNFRIYLPERMSTELKTMGGNIRLSNVRGDQMVKTSGGNIELNNLTGKVGAYTSGGNIRIERSIGTLFAQSDGGNINIDHSEGEMRVRTAGGDITTQHTRGTFIARADGGNIKGHFTEVGQGISMETGVGNIVVELPGEAGYDITASGSDINFRPTGNFSGTLNARNVEGSLNSGGISVVLRTSSGTVTIKTN